MEPFSAGGRAHKSLAEPLHPGPFGTSAASTALTQGARRLLGASKLAASQTTEQGRHHLTGMVHPKGQAGLCSSHVFQDTHQQ